RASNRCAAVLTPSTCRREAAVSDAGGFMSIHPPSLAFVAADIDGASQAAARLAALYGQSKIDQADVIVVLCGDGFMLQTLQEYMDSGKRIYGMNRGTIGFLMNEYSETGLIERIEAASPEIIRPLVMETIDAKG